MTKIFYARVDEFWRKEEKYKYLEEHRHYGNVEWQELTPDTKQTWLTGELDKDFDSFIAIGSKETKATSSEKAEAIFKTYSLGVSTNRDDVVYDFDEEVLLKRVERFCETYNAEVIRYQQKGKPKDLDNFLKYEEIKWSERLKLEVRNGTAFVFNKQNVRSAHYRPFTKKYLYFSNDLIDRLGQAKYFFPTLLSERENQSIAVCNHTQVPFSVQMLSCIPGMDVGGRPSYEFPLFTYNEDGTNRRENITDWALEQFRNHYQNQAITKWDIFNYVYALLHHPVYRERYAANLKRELPRVPFAPDFSAFAAAGKQLSELHINYESQPEYPLEKIEKPNAKLDWRVEKMKLSKDKQSITYNNFLTLARVPAAAFEYRLGNRSALEWVIDQYQVSIDKRSGITNDPNRADDPSYIVRLVGQVITVSLETMKIVNALPDLGIEIVS